MNATKYKQAFYAAPGWYEIASSRGLEIPLVVDWNSDPVLPMDWSAACEAAGFDPDDDEVGFGTVTQRRPEDKGYQVGQIAATDGTSFVVIREE